MNCTRSHGAKADIVDRNERRKKVTGKKGRHELEGTTAQYICSEHMLLGPLLSKFERKSGPMVVMAGLDVPFLERWLPAMLIYRLVVTLRCMTYIYVHVYARLAFDMSALVRVLN